MILLFPSVVPQTTVILNSDRQNAVVAKMEDPLSGRAPDPLENIISKSVARHPTSHRHRWGPGDRAASWGARVVGPRVLRGQGLGRTAWPVSTAVRAGGRYPVCSPRCADPALSPHSHLSCLSEHVGSATSPLVGEVAEAFRGGAFSTPFFFGDALAVPWVRGGSAWRAPSPLVCWRPAGVGPTALLPGESRRPSCSRSRFYLAVAQVPRAPDPKQTGRGRWVRTLRAEAVGRQSSRGSVCLVPARAESWPGPERLARSSPQDGAPRGLPQQAGTSRCFPFPVCGSISKEVEKVIQKAVACLRVMEPVSELAGVWFPGRALLRCIGVPCGAKDAPQEILDWLF